MDEQRRWPFLAGGGNAGALIEGIDWSATLVGAIAGWPSNLKTTLGIMLHSRQPMFLWWGPQLTQFYNDAYVPSFGVGKHPAAMGQHGRECWAEIWPIIGPQIEAVMSRGIPTWNEDALVPILRNGRLEEVHWTYGYSPVMSDEGTVAGTLVICTETTGRVLAERRLRLVRTLIDAMSECTQEDAILDAAYEAVDEAELDIAFMAIARNGPAAADGVRPAHGTPRNERRRAIAHDLGQRLAALSEGRELIDLPEDLRLAVEPWPETISQAFAVSMNAQLGQTVIFGLSPRLVFDASYREFLQLVVQQIERTFERLRALRLRVASEAERKNLLLQAPVATALLTGPDHVFEIANPLYRELVGGRDLLGKTYVGAFPELAGTALPDILDRVFATGIPYVSPESLIPLDRDGDGVLEDCFFRFNLEPLRDGQSVVYGMMAVAVDITEQVTARHALERASAEREALVAKLEDAARAKDEFLATVSHELRTPLTAILGWSRILRDGSQADRLRKGLAVIERNAKAQAKLIEDILDVARINSGKLRMSVGPVDVGAVIAAAVETVRPMASARAVRLTVSIPSGLGTITADEDRLQQVIWNLLSNAVKFTPPEGEVSVCAARDDSQVTLTVRDTGKGISREFLPHVFERFRQDDASTTKQQPGLGLGLAIVRHLVEAHGGTVSARSDGEDLGATFEVQLPIRAAPARRDNEARAPASDVPASIPPNASGRLGGLRVLVVDDEEDARDLIGTVLEDAGAKVLHAATATAALHILSTSSVSVLVSDVGMPKEDGYSLLQRVRSIASSSRTRGVPALALTAYARAEDRHAALAAGFQEHAAKPIDPETLVELVAALARR